MPFTRSQFGCKKLTRDDLLHLGTGLSRDGNVLAVHVEIYCSDLFDPYMSLPGHYME